MEDSLLTQTFLLLGTNQGDRLQNLLVARERLEITIGRIIKASSVYETAAWGKTDQNDFFNQVICFLTELTPAELLNAILEIELSMGRIRSERWGPRIMDIDILLFGDVVVQSEVLTIPHPAMHLRRFTLVPLAEIAGERLHPQLGESINTLLEKCPDELGVRSVEL